METRPCPNCGSPVPVEHRFCGKCGHKTEPTTAAPPASAAAKTMFFGTMQAPGRAKLVLIKGEGTDGVSYHLNATEHLTGRMEGAILFPEDALLSPRHANFVYRDGKLHVHDEGSRNGVFVRIRNPVQMESGDLFLVGEQLLRAEVSQDDVAVRPDGDGTYFYGSPRRPCRFKLAQVLRGGSVGLVFRARADAVTIGREGNDLDFPQDPFISGRHARVDHVGGAFTLTDLGSKNGTFVRVRNEAPLAHGDYVFLGQQLLRVEIT